MIITVILKKMRAAVADLLPIVLVIAFFQIIVLKQPLDEESETGHHKKSTG